VRAVLPTLPFNTTSCAFWASLYSHLPQEPPGSVRTF
jgi:hypothetical protein